MSRHPLESLGWIMLRGASWFAAIILGVVFMVAVWTQLQLGFPLWPDAGGLAAVVGIGFVLGAATVLVGWILRPRSVGAAVTLRLEAEHDAIVSAHPARRLLALRGASYNLGRMVGGRLLTEGMARDVLMGSAAVAGLIEDIGADKVDQIVSQWLISGMSRPLSHVDVASPAKHGSK